MRERPIGGTNGSRGQPAAVIQERRNRPWHLADTSPAKRQQLLRRNQRSVKRTKVSCCSCMLLRELTRFVPPHPTRRALRAHLALANELLHMNIVVGLKRNENDRGHGVWTRQVRSKSESLAKA